MPSWWLWSAVVLGIILVVLVARKVLQLVCLTKRGGQWLLISVFWFSPFGPGTFHSGQVVARLPNCQVEVALYRSTELGKHVIVRVPCLEWPQTWVGESVLLEKRPLQPWKLDKLDYDRWH
jgi:hypothetical protein